MHTTFHVPKLNIRFTQIVSTTIVASSVEVSLEMATFKCESCGATSSSGGECCGAQMKRVS